MFLNLYIQKAKAQETFFIEFLIHIKEETKHLNMFVSYSIRFKHLCGLPIQYIYSENHKFLSSFFRSKHCMIGNLYFF